MEKIAHTPCLNYPHIILNDMSNKRNNSYLKKAGIYMNKYMVLSGNNHVEIIRK